MHGKFNSSSVLNTFEFVEKVKDITIQDDEIMVSFDVQQLFPSIPVDVALESIKHHLETHNIEQEKIEVYLNATRFCMQYNCFVFRDKFYKSDLGTSMGNPLSPFVAEAFMAKLESDLKKDGLLPEVFHRYVDDIFSKLKRNEVQNVLNTLNSRYESIKFTFEAEDDNNSLPFLDVLCKKVRNKIEFEVYRKSTATDRYTTNDSFCSYQHKIAVFHSLVHRLCRLPLSVGAFKKEFDHIVHLAEVNGFEKPLIEKIVQKQQRKIASEQSTTLFSQNETLKTENEIEHRVSFSFMPAITNKLRQHFKKENIHIVYNSKNKLKNILGSTKDVTKTADKSGIYEISCMNCNKKYIGQSKRSISARFKEHRRNITKKQTNLSAVSAHVWSVCDEEGEPTHTIDVFDNSVRLLKNVLNDRHLDAYESMYIHKEENLMNTDEIGNIVSPLFTLL